MHFETDDGEAVLVEDGADEVPLVARRPQATDDREPDRGGTAAAVPLTRDESARSSRRRAQAANTGA